MYVCTYDMYVCTFSRHVFRTNVEMFRKMDGMGMVSMGFYFLLILPPPKIYLCTHILENKEKLR